MASGCNSNSFNSQSGCIVPVSSNCIDWQGLAYPTFDICVGDTGTEVITSLITSVISILDGTGITLSSVTGSCTFMSDQLAGQTKTISNLVQILFNSACSLDSRITTLEESADTPISYDVKCLTVTGSTTPLVLQGAINEICSLKIALAQITDNIVGDDINTTITNTVGNYLQDNLSSCGSNGMQVTGSGSTTKIKFDAFVPHNVPMPYIGSLGNFDSTGKGLAGTEYCGWYIMNGLNGTPNWMGYVPAMATALPGINSTPLDARVAGVDVSAAIGDKKGEPKHLLSTNEMPTHSHTVTDPGHSHSIQLAGAGGTFAGANVANDGNAVSNTNGTAIQIKTTGITIAPSGNNVSHENRQPTVYVTWIVRLP